MIMGHLGSSLATIPYIDGAYVARRTGRTEQLGEQVSALLDKARFAVIHAGDRNVDGAVIHPTVNTRSWKSYEAVAHDIADALRRLGCRHVEIFPEDMRLGSALRADRTDFVWLNSGGVQGYDPVCHGPAILEQAGIAYVGHNPLISSTLDNKHSFKRELLALGIPTARFITWHMGRGDLEPSQSRHFRNTFGDYPGPFVVKPVSGRASLHVHVIDEVSQIAECAREIHEVTQNHVLIEEYLSGREYCVAVCGPIVADKNGLRHLDKPFAFSALERVLAPDESIFTSMDVSPITQNRLRLLDRAEDKETVQELLSLAQSVYTDMCLETLVRIDVRANSDGQLHVLEANPKPDLKAPKKNQTNLVCVGLEQHNMSYDNLILSLLADRIDIIFGQKRGTSHHLLSLIQ